MTPYSEKYVGGGRCGYRDVTADRTRYGSPTHAIRRRLMDWTSSLPSLMRRRRRFPDRLSDVLSVARGARPSFRPAAISLSRYIERRARELLVTWPYESVCQVDRPTYRIIGHRRWPRARQLLHFADLSHRSQSTSPLRTDVVRRSKWYGYLQCFSN